MANQPRHLCLFFVMFCLSAGALPAQQLSAGRRGIDRSEAAPRVTPRVAYTPCAAHRGQDAALGGIIGGLLGYALGSLLGGAADLPGGGDRLRWEITVGSVGIGAVSGLIVASRSPDCS